MPAMTHQFVCLVVSTVQALFAVGAIFGGPIAGYFLGFGRKLTLMICALPYVAGWVLLATCEAVPLLYIGRILTGLGAGMTSLVTPVSTHTCMRILWVFSLPVFPCLSHQVTC